MKSKVIRMRVFDGKALTPEAKALVKLPGAINQTLLAGGDGSSACVWQSPGVFLIEDTSANWAEEAVRLFLADGQIKEMSA
jgi:hypothetical protein